MLLGGSRSWEAKPSSLGSTRAGRAQKGPWDGRAAWEEVTALNPSGVGFSPSLSTAKDDDEEGRAMDPEEEAAAPAGEVPRGSCKSRQSRLEGEIKGSRSPRVKAALGFGGVGGSLG